MRDDYWTPASTYTRKHSRCDYGGCERPVRRIHVREGFPMVGYCYEHYLDAKGNEAAEVTGDGT